MTRLIFTYFFLLIFLRCYRLFSLKKIFHLVEKSKFESINQNQMNLFLIFVYVRDLQHVLHHKRFTKRDNIFDYRLKNFMMSQKQLTNKTEYS